MVPHIHLVCWTRSRVFRGEGEQVCRSAGGTSFHWRGPWNLVIMVKGKGGQHWIFLDDGPLAPERVLVFKFQLDPSPVCVCVSGGWDARLWFQVQLEVKVLPSAHDLST